MAVAIKRIEEELDERLAYFTSTGKLLEHQRLKQRVEFDLEMLQTTGMCKGVENYSRLLTDKKPGEAPFTLLDYFAQRNQDYLVIVDESHVSLPQYRGMYAGDRARKEVLVDYGFRLPSALDNRPLKFEEFIKVAPHFLFVSATPADMEIELSSEVGTQIIRPTGLLDPNIQIMDSEHQVEKLHDIIKEIAWKKRAEIVGRNLEVLVEKSTQQDDGKFLNMGRSREFFEVWFGSSKPQLNEEVKVNIISSGVGGITENDVELVNNSENCILLGFNVRPTGAVKAAAKQKGVEIKTYNIIYNMICIIFMILNLSKRYK